MTADAGPPPLEVFQAFEMVDSGDPRFTLSQFKAVRNVLSEYHHSPTWWEVERPQLEQLLHHITHHLEQHQPSHYAE